MGRLIPADRVFFQMLDELATRLRSAASLLSDLLEHPDQQEPLARLIRADEHAADSIAHGIVLRLSTSFVPPFDATDIYALARALDATIDVIEDAAARVCIFEIRAPDPRARELAELVFRCAGVLESAVHGLADARSPLEGVSEAWRLEEEGDAIYAAAMHDLFASGCPPLDLIKRKEVFDILEDALDSAKDVAEVLSSIGLKLG